MPVKIYGPRGLALYAGAPIFMRMVAKRPGQFVCVSQPREDHMPSDESIKMMSQFLYPKNLYPTAFSKEMLARVEEGADLLDRMMAQARWEEARMTPHDSDCKQGEWFPALQITSDCTCGRKQRIAELERLAGRGK